MRLTDWCSQRAPSGGFGLARRDAGCAVRGSTARGSAVTQRAVHGGEAGGGRGGSGDGQKRTSLLPGSPRAVVPPGPGLGWAGPGGVQGAGATGHRWRDRAQVARLAALVAGGEDAADLGGRAAEVLTRGDPLRPGPPEPPLAV